MLTVVLTFDLLALSFFCFNHVIRLQFFGMPFEFQGSLKFYTMKQKLKYELNSFMVHHVLEVNENNQRET